MNQQAPFSAILLLMPEQEAARCLLLLNQNEQLDLLCLLQTPKTHYLPAVVAGAQLTSLEPLQHYERKTGGILMALAELAGYPYVAELLTAWSKRQPQILADLRNHLFFFEEIIYLSDRLIQRIFQEIKLKPLMLAGCAPAVTEKLLANVSQRVARQLRDELHQLEELQQATPEEIYLAKGAFARRVAALLQSGIIDPAEISLPEMQLPELNSVL